MRNKKKMLDLFTTEIDRQFSMFSDKVSISSFNNVKLKTFDFEVVVDEIKTGVSGISVPYAFFNNCSPGDADAICDRLLQGYVLYLESAFEGKRIISEDLETVKRG